MIKNSDILFIYDAKLCNPNGDPDDENKPRMDYETRTNLVSDVRLKRYIRDYLESKGYEIFVAKVDGETVDATTRLKKFFEKQGKEVSLSKLSKEDINFILSKLIDVRMFGATMPIKAKEGETKGASSNFTGPIQFNWGYSLNKVELVESASITSTFAGKDTGGKGEYGTFGKDWRVYYSLIAFHGIISGYRAEHTKLTEEDIKLLDESLLFAIPKMASTRSKIGQTPRFILRIEYKDKETFLGDLRDRVKISPIEGLRDISDFEINFTELEKLLKENQNKIERIFIYEDKDLKILNGSLKERLSSNFKVINIPY